MNTKTDVLEKISQLEPALLQVIEAALPVLEIPEEIQLKVGLELPRTRSNGDLALSVAMQLASRLKRPPLELAEKLSEAIQEQLAQASVGKAISAVEVKPPGFINFWLSHDYLAQVLSEALQLGEDFGRTDFGQKQPVLTEYVSANPTGPLSVAHGRQAAVGDALANLLDFAGYEVYREYYLNDEGTQIDLLGKSVLAKGRQSKGIDAEFPENGYKGAYVGEIAQRWAEDLSEEELSSDAAELSARKFGADQLTEKIRGELDLFGVYFDNWYPQSSLKDEDYLENTLNDLRAKKVLYEEGGAWWLKSTDFGDDKDRVVVRSDGRLTYIASDIAYHRKKLERGYKMLVNLWGPDHHGYIARLRASIEALGFEPDAMQVRIIQICTLKRGEETIPMSTREGEFITLEEVIREVGKDATRFFFLLRKADAHLEFDLELAKQHSMDNPVYYIQYAHARIVSIINKAKSEGVEIGDPLDADFSKLQAKEELALLRTMREFSGAVNNAAKSLEPFGMIVYLQSLSEGLHRFYDAHRVVGEDAALTQARLSLIQGVQAVLANGLRLLGVSIPDHM